MLGVKNIDRDEVNENRNNPDMNSVFPALSSVLTQGADL